MIVHRDQTAAEVPAHGALIRPGAGVSAQVLDHGGVVPRPLATQTTVEWLLTFQRTDRRRHVTVHTVHTHTQDYSDKWRHVRCTLTHTHTLMITCGKC